MPRIQTPRLDLVPYSADFLIASLEGDLSHAARLINAHLPADWPHIPHILRMRLDQLTQTPALLPFLLHGMVRLADRVLLGYIGFHAGPDHEDLRPYAPHALEIGFTLFEPHRRQGYTHEAAAALIDWACQTHQVRNFIMTIAPDNIASQGLAAKLGFAKVGQHMDEVDGPEDVFRLTYS